MNLELGQAELIPLNWYEYRNLVDPIRGVLFSKKRHQRVIFSQHYSEIESVLADSGATLDEFEK